MSISYSDVGDLRKIMISGRLDVDGTNSVAAQLEELAKAPKQSVMVDLSSLKFLASIGIRALITSAKAVKARGGKMVIVVNKSSTVMMSIQATGVDQFVPVFDSANAAEKAVTA